MCSDEVLSVSVRRKGENGGVSKFTRFFLFSGFILALPLRNMGKKGMIRIPAHQHAFFLKLIRLFFRESMGPWSAEFVSGARTGAGKFCVESAIMGLNFVPVMPSCGMNMFT